VCLCVDRAADSYSKEYVFVCIMLLTVTVLNVCVCVDRVADSYSIECVFVWIRLLTVTVLNVCLCGLGC